MYRTKPRFEMMNLLTSGYFQALKLSEEAGAEGESLKGNDNTVISFTELTSSLLNIGYLFIYSNFFVFKMAIPIIATFTFNATSL